MLYPFSGFTVLIVVGIVTILTLGLVKVYLWLIKGVCKSKNILMGKTVIITGANAGIGKETAIDLASRGARVIMACRDLKKASKAKDDVIEASGNTNVVVKHLNLASLNSVRKFAADILKSEPRLDILINNAGCAAYEKKLTEDGLEYQMQSNYFGHFLLTNLLLNLIIKTDRARIINVSSDAHYMCKHLDVNDLNFEKNPSAGKFLTIYAASKLCNILFTKELARKLESLGTNVYSCHPGFVNTDFGRFIPWPMLILFLSYTVAFFSKTSKEGAQTTIHLAVADEVANITGEYFSDCKIAKTSKLAKDDGLAKKLWEVSETMVKLQPEDSNRKTT